MSVNVGSAIGYLDLDISKFKTALKSAQGDLKSFTNSTNSTTQKWSALGGAMATTGKALTLGVTVPLAALATASVKTASDFQAGMSKVQAISGATGKDMKKLEKLAKDMGATTKFSATEASNALSYMGMAGWKAEDMMAGLPGILDLAAAGGTDLAITSDIVTDGLTALGATAEDTKGFVDIMAATITNSNTSIELMGESLKYVGPVAGALGISMDDLSLAIGLVGNAGIKGSAAGTALRAGLTNLVKPTKQMKDAMNKYGVEIVKTESGSVDFMGTMDNLRKKLGDLDETTQAAALASIFGKEAMSSWAAIVNASEDDFNKLSDAILESNGKASDLAKTMQDNLKGSFDNMKSSLEGVLINIGERLIPMVQKVVEKLTDLFTWFNNLSPKAQDLAIKIGLVSMAIGPLLLVIGNVLIKLPLLVDGINLVKLAFGKLVAWGSATLIPFLTTTAFTIGAITIPVWAVIAVIGALIAIGVFLVKNWDEIKVKAQEVWQYICETVQIWVDTATQWVKDKWEEAKQNVADSWQWVKDKAVEIWEGIGNFFTITIPTMVDNIVKWFDELPYKIGYALGELLGNIILWGIETWNYLEKNVPLWIEGVSNWFSELPGKVWTWLLDTASKVLAWGQDMWNTMSKYAQLAIDGVLQWFIQLPGKLYNWLLQALNKMARWGSDMIKKGLEAGSKTLDAVIKGIKNLPSKLSEIGKNAVESLWNGINNMKDWIVGKISGFVSGIVAGFGSVAGKISSALKGGRSIQLEVEDPTIPQFRYEDTLLNMQKAKSMVMSDSIAKGILSKASSRIKDRFDFGDGKEAKSGISNSFEINLNIDKFENNSDKDIEQIYEELGFLIKKKQFGLG